MLLLLSLVLAAAATGATFPSVASRLVAPLPRAATFALSTTLGDNMALQRDTPATVWGFAAPGASVKTSFAGNTYTSTAGADGIWRQALPATPANAVGQTISFSASTGEVAALQNVVFGDVYICSGEWWLAMGFGRSVPQSGRPFAFPNRRDVSRLPHCSA
jgi:hypothetical protein